METVICDVTAFNYWRCPPVVKQLVAAAQAGDPSFGPLGASELAAFGERLARESRLCQGFLRPNPSTRAHGRATKALRQAVPLLAVCQDDPIDILQESRSACHASSLVRSHLCCNLSCVKPWLSIGHDVSVTTPAFALLQVAARASLARTVMLASELCGSFAVYSPPPAVKDCLQTMQNRGGIPAIGDWRPYVDQRGRVTGIWSRPALMDARDMTAVVAAHGPKRGGKTLKAAADLVVPGAASPFEVQAGMLLGFPRNRGGEGYEGLEFNRRIKLTRPARRLAQRDSCYCDLYWECGLDLECQSALVHQNEVSFLSDSDRTLALKSMGIEVLPVTFGQLADEARFEALSSAVCKVLGRRPRPKTERQRRATRELRRELFGCDWADLGRV